MINFSKISKNSVLGKFLRAFLKLIPKNIVILILQGRLKGKKWVKGSGINSYWLGTYEIEKQKLFEKIVKPSNVVFDIGSHVGFYTLLASELVGKEGKVFSFEPLPRNISYLKKHIEMNKCNNVIVVEAAVYDNEGEVFFGDFFGGWDKSFYGRIIDYQKGIKVKSVILDNLIKNNELVAPNVLKIDVEGNEYLALKGAENTLKQYHPSIFLATHNEKVRNDCLNLLQNLGYNFKTITEKDISEIFAY